MPVPRWGNPLSRCTSGAPIRLRRGLTSPSLHGTVADGVESRVGHISPVGYPPSVICRTAHNPTLFVEQGFLPLPPQFRCSSVPLRDTPGSWTSSSAPYAPLVLEATFPSTTPRTMCCHPVTHCALQSVRTSGVGQRRGWVWASLAGHRGLNSTLASSYP